MRAPRSRIEERVLAIIDERGAVTNDDIARAFDRSPKAAGALLCKLRRRGVIVGIGTDAQGTMRNVRPEGSPTHGAWRVLARALGYGAAPQSDGRVITAGAWE